MFTEDAQPRDYRRNAACFLVDYVTYAVGIVFINVTTVLPSLVRQLTDSTILIGLITTIQAAGYLLPQLVAARWVQGRAKKRRFITIPGLIGRPAIWVVAATIALFGSSRPNLTLAVFFAGFMLLSFTEGLISVPLFDVFAKVIPVTRRGRLLGTAQVIYGILALGASAVITYLLGAESALGFPYNYAVLFLLAGVGLAVSLVALASIREPEGTLEGAIEQPDTPRVGYLRLLAHIVSHDRRFVALVVTRALLGYAGMAYPFYVLSATDALGLGEQTIGLFVLAQMGGSILGGIVLGALNERRGSIAVIRVNVGISLAMPLTGVLVHMLSGSVLHGALLYLYVIVFLAIGLVNSSLMLGFIPCLLEIAPEGERPVYLGLANTLNALILPAALIGAWILEMTSFPVLFLVSACCSGLAALPASRIARQKERVLVTPCPSDDPA